MLLMALSVAGCAGYFSVWGLSQLFAGASTAVIIMATVLEIGKVITTTALHRYWGSLSKTLKAYLSIAVIILMLITSAGIYGFLSNAYQKTANKLEIHEGELSVLDGKKAIFEKNISDNEKIITSKNKRIDQLTNLRNNQENRLDSAKTTKAKTAVRNDIALATQEIQKLTNEIDGLNLKNNIQSDSVGSYNVKALQLKSTSEVSGEVGPLKYIAELTGAPMGNVVNYLILLLIFVFDPLAIALVLMTNRVFELENLKNPLEPKKDSTKEVLKELIKYAENSNEGANEGANEGVNEEVSEGEINYDKDMVDDDNDIDVSEEFASKWMKKFEEKGFINDEMINETLQEYQKEHEVEETKLVSDKEVEVPVFKKEPVIPTGKIEVDEIKEVKQRGFSVPVPNPKTNNIQRISGSEPSRLFFRRNK